MFYLSCFLPTNFPRTTLLNLGDLLVPSQQQQLPSHPAGRWCPGCGVSGPLTFSEVETHCARDQHIHSLIAEAPEGL